MCVNPGGYIPPRFHGLFCDFYLLSPPRPVNSIKQYVLYSNTSIFHSFMQKTTTAYSCCVHAELTGGAMWYKKKTKLYLDYHVIFSDHWTWNGPQRSGRIFYSLSAPRFFPASCTPTFYSSLMIYPPPRQHIIFPLNKRVEMPQRHREENKNKLNFSCFTYTCYLRRI